MCMSVRPHIYTCMFGADRCQKRVLDAWNWIYNWNWIYSCESLCMFPAN
ncbi:mCG147857 [Mus musculus]|nr:mCG147857 [Mus musculus]